MNLQNNIESLILKNSQIAIIWLGQAGFLIKDSDGNIIAIDPYLSDCGQRIRGFKRLSPKLISPYEIKPDIYITTHTHFDHFDFDAIPIIATCQKTHFFGPITCIDKYKEIGINEDKFTLLEVGNEIKYGEVTIQAAYADHGTLAPDNIGILIKVNEVKLYFSGDTAYHPEKMDEVKNFKPDIAVLSVNGKFGNLNNEEGAKVANYIGSKIAIPCHFWTFKEHGGDPQGFEEEMSKYAPNCKIEFMYQGQIFVYDHEII